MENCFRPIFVKSSLGAMALTNDSVSRYLEEIQKKKRGRGELPVAGNV